MFTQHHQCAGVDDSIGPWAGECRGGFDFTLLFEETILSILPLAIVLLVAPFRIFYLSKRDKKVGKSYLLPLKLVSPSIPVALSAMPFPCLIVFYGIGAVGGLDCTATRSHRPLGCERPIAVIENTSITCHCRSQLHRTGPPLPLVLGRTRPQCSTLFPPRLVSLPYAAVRHR
jgi:hypothetical protein